MDITTFYHGFKRNIINKGFDVKFGSVNKCSALIIMEDPVIGHVIRPDLTHSSGFDDKYKRMYDKGVEEEENIRRMRYGKIKKTISDYKQMSNTMLSYIKNTIDESEKEICIMSVECIYRYLGDGFEVFGEYAIFKNIKAAMEDHNIMVGLTGHDEKSRWKRKYISFWYKRDCDQFIWEREGFISREEYEDCIKEERKCRKVKKIVNECKSRDPNSVFNNKELVKKIFTGCDTDEEN